MPPVFCHIHPAHYPSSFPSLYFRFSDIAVQPLQKSHHYLHHTQYHPIYAVSRFLPRLPDHLHSSLHRRAQQRHTDYPVLLLSILCINSATPAFSPAPPGQTPAGNRYPKGIPLPMQTSPAASGRQIQALHTSRGFPALQDNPPSIPAGHVHNPSHHPEDKVLLQNPDSRHVRLR